MGHTSYVHAYVYYKKGKSRSERADALSAVRAWEDGRPTQWMEDYVRDITVLSSSRALRMNTKHLKLV